MSGHWKFIMCFIYVKSTKSLESDSFFTLVRYKLYFFIHYEIPDACSLNLVRIPSKSISNRICNRFVLDVFDLKNKNISFKEDGLLKGYNRSVSHQTNMSPFYEVKK